jgi:hypothetical protein
MCVCVCVCAGHADVVRTLLRRGAVIVSEATEAAGLPSPYVVAAMEGRAEVARVLGEEAPRGSGGIDERGALFYPGTDGWGQEKRPAVVWPEALLSKARPAIGDRVLLPASHPAAASHCVGVVAGPYDENGAVSVFFWLPF